MTTGAIEYFNRDTKTIEVEAVYGDAFLRWAYCNPIGRLSVFLVAKRALFSRWYGWRMKRPVSRNRVKPFIRDFNVDAKEFVCALDEFSSFNDFFVRKLKAEARPVDPDELTVVFPADGRHLGFQDISRATGFFVKGQRFHLEAFLGDSQLSERFQNGTAVLSRLCPLDYHRFHFPFQGTPASPSLINGPLSSVNPIALRRNLAILWRNKRMLTLLDTEKLGSVLIMEIGATNVGSIQQTFIPDRPVRKGAEKGFFEFGGSATFTLFEAGRVQLSEDLVHHSAQCRELYARMGDRLGRAC